MSAAKILGDKDRNAHMAEQPLFKDVKSVEAKDVKSMEYHRQVLQSKVQCPEEGQYVSPSDNIMSPCTARLTNFRNRNASKAKPKSLFAKASAKRLEGESVKKTPGESALGATPVTRP